MRSNLPKQLLKGDFQDYPLWREMNYSMLKYLTEEYDGTLIVPMTVVHPPYFEEIVGRLRGEGVTVHHFALCASRETLLARLRRRGDGPRSWPAQQVDRCIRGLSLETFRHHLDTERIPVEAVAETIAAMANLPLRPDRRGKMRRAWDRAMTQIRHIRFFT